VVRARWGGLATGIPSIQGSVPVMRELVTWPDSRLLRFSVPALFTGRDGLV